MKKQFSTMAMALMVVFLLSGCKFASIDPDMNGQDFLPISDADLDVINDEIESAQSPNELEGRGLVINSAESVEGMSSSQLRRFAVTVAGPWWNYYYRIDGPYDLEITGSEPLFNVFGYALEANDELIFSEEETNIAAMVGNVVWSHDSLVGHTADGSELTLNYTLNGRTESITMPVSGRGRTTHRSGIFTISLNVY